MGRATRIAALVVAALTAGCQGSGGGGSGSALDVPTVAADLTIRDADIRIGEVTLRVRLTPDQVQEIMSAIGSDGSGK